MSFINPWPTVTEQDHIYKFWLAATGYAPTYDVVEDFLRNYTTPAIEKAISAVAAQCKVTPVGIDRQGELIEQLLRA